MARHRTIYLSPEGKEVSQNTWLEQQNRDPDAWILKRYENDRISIQLRATSRIFSDGSVPKEYWKRFSVVVENIITTDFEGNPLLSPERNADPDASGEFYLLGAATAHYRLLLARYTESQFNGETGEFEERGNKLSPDAPTTVATSSKVKSEDFGSW